MDGLDGASRLPSDADIVERLLAGDADCFAAVVDTWGPGLRRFAAALLPRSGGADPAALDAPASDADADADAVVRAGLLAALGDLSMFAGMVALKTWLYRRVLDALPVPVTFSVCPEDTVPVLDPDRFRPPDAPLYPGGWREGQMPGRWPMPLTTDSGTTGLLLNSLASLPARQRAVLLLRDAEGCQPADVSWLLGIDLADQRILLRAARASLRNAVDDHYAKISGGEVSQRELR